MTDSQQQFCLRWNNFQANITSQFEALRDEEDFVDVTFACDGRRLQAHKVVLSACSPYFKELFKTNPCKHPIIFMRDVEFEHLQSLLEFVYAGEVNISQAELPTFLRTAESLQIRGLTDSQNNQHNNEKHSKSNNIHTSNGRGLISPSFDDERSKTPPPTSPPPLKRLCKRSDSPINSSPVPPAVPAVAAAAAATVASATGTPRNRPLSIEPQVQLDCYKDLDIVEPKVELPEYGSDDDCSPKQEVNALPGGFLSLDGGMEVLPSYPPSYAGSGIEGGLAGPSHGSTTELNQEQQADLRKLHSLDPRPCPVCNRMYSNLSNLRQHMRLIHNPQSVTCPLCNKPFKTKLYLKRHLVSFHELSVADRQRQEEIYQHQVKVQVHRSSPTSLGGAGTIVNNPLATVANNNGQVQQQQQQQQSPLTVAAAAAAGQQENNSCKSTINNKNLLGTATSAPPPRLPPEDVVDEAPNEAAPNKLRGYREIEDSGSYVQVGQLTTNDAKSFGVGARRVRRGRPRLGTRGGRHLSSSVHGNSPSRNDWLPGPLDMSTTPPAMPAFRGFEDSAADGVVHLGEGIAVCEEQLRAVKWSDYRKLTRGLAAILFSPTELATCSVTGQRWSRAGTATERPVKPALDRAKVQAIISYVTSRFPSVDVSSVKQVLAYKCKENSTALKMKSIRYICERQDTETSPAGETEDK